MKQNAQAHGDVAMSLIRDVTMPTACVAGAADGASHSRRKGDRTSLGLR